MSRRAVFLDRDGVIVEDVDRLTDAAHIRVLDGAPEAIERLKRAGYLVFVVTNQTVVARGLASEAEVEAVNRELNRRLGGTVDAFCVCPHHPSAAVEAYRAECACRKPRPGLLLQAADESGIDLTSSFMVGDRITDIIAGATAGCRTILVRSSATGAPPIETPEPIDPDTRADYECDSLTEAVEAILGGVVA